MSFHFVFVFCVLIVLVQGSQKTQVEPVSSVEAHSGGSVSSGAAISFPEVRPAPGSQAKSQAARPVATRPVATYGRRQTGYNSRPAAIGSAGRPIGGGANHAQNRNWIQKPY
ncbi:uncharacterized protein LOC26526670 [Drosophila erecta]|uniref:uncharacterized protein LOC26526670 n=1 Tax=Drosophila erecta TaxID=7220 RepID=UPI000732B8CA|nr:uncharacterized protein LOC26526670 [Drosophila erecta]KQS38876.1 uncharacterized protein Dere_GG26846 [Drosophila erecta]